MLSNWFRAHLATLMPGWCEKMARNLEWCSLDGYEGGICQYRDYRIARFCKMLGRCIHDFDSCVPLEGTAKRMAEQAPAFYFNRCHACFSACAGPHGNVSAHLHDKNKIKMVLLL